MATTEELQTRLDEAETALHKLLTGQQTVRLEYDGKSVTYTAASAGDLRAYIGQLQVNLGLKSRRSRAITVGF